MKAATAAETLLDMARSALSAILKFGDGGRRGRLAVGVDARVRHRRRADSREVADVVAAVVRVAQVSQRQRCGDLP